jgi:hypothetical protein
MEKYVVGTYEDDSGNLLVKVVVPDLPPKQRISSSVIQYLPLAAKTLTDAPAFNWTYGCSATSAGMFCGYYDRNGYPDMYTGTINGGVCPLNNSAWGAATEPGSSGECPMIATHQGIEARVAKGHVDDYWVDYNETGDPYYGNWTAHNVVGEGDCLADFMGTSQWYPDSLNNSDGATSYSYYTAGQAYSPPSFGDLAWGVQAYIEYKGYTVSSYYNQLISGYDGNTAGFTFQQYADEIDAGNPVFIHVTGHTMLGVGYDDSTSTVYLHDTWDYSTHSMIWGGIYSSMTNVAVTVVKIEKALSLITISGASSIDENTSSQYTCTASYSDGSTANVSIPTTWAENSSYAIISSAGLLTATSVTSDQNITIIANYTYDGITKFDTHAVTIEDAPDTYEDWLAELGVPVDEQGYADDPADDGIQNLLKYAIGLNPMIVCSSADVLESVSDETNGVSIVYKKAKGTEGVELLPLWTDYLLPSNWNSNGFDFEIISQTVSNATWKATHSVTGECGYIRLQATAE